MKKELKAAIKKIPVCRKILYTRFIYKFYHNSYDISKNKFFSKYFDRIYIQRILSNKAEQIVSLINKVDIVPVENDSYT